MTAETKAANHLIHESSPYLRQHAYNPVAWYPWGSEALAHAKAEDKPIFLSIGYSACHWCHVMEDESFEDDETAGILNEHFISIKVDREERPDLDQIYMNAVMALTGHGGWPMSVFLTPDLQPFYGGTYFPLEPRPGLPTFKQVLQGVIEAWNERRADVAQSAAQLTTHLAAMTQVEKDERGLGEDLITNAVRMLENAFDATYGGFGRAPKFPHPLELKLVLRAWQRSQDDELMHIVRLTLDRMAMGGMYDQLGGGFARYSTDNRWLVPHFEKMLYDNALLCQVYLEAFQATGEASYCAVVEETLAWVRRDMTSAAGAFHSAFDADSEGVEGKFYVWSRQEVRQLLGEELADLIEEVYDISDPGNWEGHNILNRPKTYTQCAKLMRVDEADLRAKVNNAKGVLLAARSKRVTPLRDDKVLTAWNGLMIAAFAQAAQVLDGAYAADAVNAADFILTNMRGANGRLLRTCLPGSPAKLNAYLEDYSFMIDALVSLYEATFDLRWLSSALELADIMIDQFWDGEAGGFYFVGKDHEQLLVRGKEPHDGATPSGNSMAALGLLRLYHLTGRADFEEKAVRTLQLFRGLMAQAPTAAGQMLVALDFQLGPVEEFAVVGPSSKAVEAAKLIQSGFRPRKVVAGRTTQAAAESGKLIPLLSDKAAPEGEVATYICRNFTCQQPLVGLAALRTALHNEKPPS
jgi:uncharacterized protein YyaL (SSP411 family)